MDDDKKLLLQQKLKVLQQNYATNLPDKLSELETLWQTLLSDPAKQDVMVNLHRALHSLAGSGGTYGFAEMGATARKAEILLNGVLSKELDFGDIQQGLAQILDYLPETIGDKAAPIG